MKYLLSLILGAVLAFSGDVEAKLKLDEPKVDYNWNQYIVTLKKLPSHDFRDAEYRFKRNHITDKIIEDKCTLKYTNFKGIEIVLEDDGCDNKVDWITDSTGTYLTANIPKERANNANDVYKTFKKDLEINKIHKIWKNPT